MGCPSWALLWLSAASSAGAADRSVSYASCVLPALGRDINSLGSGDFDGDGKADLLVAAYSSPETVCEEGDSCLLSFGGVEDLGCGPPGLSIGQGAAGSLSWHANVDVGDVNGDGYADAALPTVLEGNYPQILVYHGGASGLAADPVVEITLPSQMGGVVFTALDGDADGDGYSDLLVVTGTHYEGYYDKVEIFLGSASTLAAEPSFTLADYRMNDWVHYAGDINGDGADETILIDWDNGPVGLGVFWGPLFQDKQEDQVFDAVAGSDSYFGSLGFGRAGDVDGDGYGDVGIGDFGAAGDYNYPGRFDLYSGSAAGLGSVPTSSLWGETGDEMGVAVAGIGDVDEDGFGDVVVGTGAGDRVYVYWGGAGGVSNDARFTMEAPVAGDRFGESLTALRVGNGVDGFAVSSISPEGTGAVYLFSLVGHALGHPGDSGGSHSEDSGLSWDSDGELAEPSTCGCRTSPGRGIGSALLGVSAVLSVYRGRRAFSGVLT